MIIVWFGLSYECLLFKMEIIKSTHDRKLMRYIKLDNELEVLLVSDRTTPTSSVALGVRIGAYHNTDIEGISHLLEHTILMGSEKYPNENTYNKMVEEYDGYSNAHTNNDNTIYHFHCIPKRLMKILDVFSQLFTCPSYEEGSIKREMNAVHSEFIDSLTEEARLFDAVRKQFIVKSHPARNFHTGNLETLNVPDIRGKLIDFYNSHYSSNIMKLVICGKESLDKLEFNVKQMFSLIPNKHVIANTDYGYMFEAPIYCRFVPNNNNHNLCMEWQYTLSDLYNQNHISHFICHITGHEGEGSLFDFLRQRFLVKSLESGLSDQQFFNKIILIDIDLTNYGLDNIDLVKNIVFKYIQTIAHSPYHDLCDLYNEYRKVREVKFGCSAEGDNEFFVKKTVEHWVKNKINPMYLASHEYIFNDYTQKIHYIVTDILKSMTDKNSIIFESSKSFDKDSLLVEKYCNAKYEKCQFVPQNFSMIKDEFSLPNKNKYICDYPKIIPYGNNKIPVKLPINNISLWWCCSAEKYIIPNIMLEINVILKNKNITCKNKLLAEIYLEYVNYLINADLYNVNLTSYIASINESDNGFYIGIDGYPEKFADVLELLLSGLNLHGKITESIFNHIKENIIEHYGNYECDKLSYLGEDILFGNVTKECYDVKDSIKILSEISFDDFKDYKLFDDDCNNNQVCGLIQGNCPRGFAMKFGNIISKLNVSKFKFYGKWQLKDNLNNEFVSNIQNGNNSSCFVLSVKIGCLRPEYDSNYYRTLVLLEILHNIINEHFFDQLRTKDQLGYTVSSCISGFGNDFEQQCKNYNFVIQSPNNDSKFLKERVFKFVRDFKNYLEEADETIENVIESQLLRISEKFETLYDAVEYNFDAIMYHGANFNIRKDKIKFMETIDKKMLIAFYDKYFSLKKDTFWTMSIN